MNPVDEYALQLLKEFDRKRLKSTINLLSWTSMLLQHQQFYTRHLLLWSGMSVTYAAPVTRMTAPTTVVTLPVTTVMIAFFFQRHLRNSSISPSEKKKRLTVSRPYTLDHHQSPPANTRPHKQRGDFSGPSDTNDTACCSFCIQKCHWVRTQDGVCIDPEREDASEVEEERQQDGGGKVEREAAAVNHFPDNV